MHKIIKICQLGLIVFLCICGESFNANAEIIRGKARIIDGDTVVIQGEKIRLACIDTPESNYRGKTQYCLDNETDCGFLAKQALDKMIGDNEVSCYYEQRDIYGRILGHCFKSSYYPFGYIGKGTYNYDLIDQGYAWYYRGGKNCRLYKKAFEQAQKEQRGLFDEEIGGFKEPKLWRKNKSNN